jgi:fumarate hydratase class II
MADEHYRTESDSMGEVPVAADALWGAQTQRAVANFSVSPLRIPAPLIRALGIIKRAAAVANRELGLLEAKLAEAIVQAAQEVIDGKWDAQFPIDVFQTGSGTSWNMNANEVIANRANQLLGAPLGRRSPVHPNDHVNRGQSSNDVIPTAIAVADRQLLEPLLAALGRLHGSLDRKAREMAQVLKIGRTHLQDAVPMTLGQEISGWARQVEKAREALVRCRPDLEELAIGGTAVGTGLNAHPGFGRRVAEEIGRSTGLPFAEAANRFEAMAARDAQVQLAARVMGSCLTISLGGQSGPLELNMAQPLIAWETLSSLELLANTCDALAARCIDGMRADEERCRWWIEQSPALVTPLAVRIGYDRAAALARQAFAEHKTIREVVIEQGILSREEAAQVLDPAAMVGPRPPR